MCAEATMSINSISMPPKRERLLIKLHRHYLQADVVRINTGTRLRAIMTYQPGDDHHRAPKQIIA